MAGCVAVYFRDGGVGLFVIVRDGLAADFVGACGRRRVGGGGGVLWGADGGGGGGEVLVGVVVVLVGVESSCGGRHGRVGVIGGGFGGEGVGVVGGIGVGVGVRGLGLSGGVFGVLLVLLHAVIGLRRLLLRHLRLSGLGRCCCGCG